MDEVSVSASPPMSASLKSYNPASCELLGDVSVTSPEQVRQIVEAARAAQPSWAASAITQRAALLARVAEFLDQESEAVATLITKEQGKVLHESRSEVRDAAHRLRYFASQGPQFLAGRVENRPGIRCEVAYRPAGVVAAIKPWNFPVGIPIWTLGPALLAGNAVIFKPSQLTPLVGACLTNLFHRAGIPKDILALVQGDDAVGRALVAAPINMVSFVGSQSAGIAIMRQAALEVKRVTLELGGKDPMIVCEDADIPTVASAAIEGAFKNCGQVCCSVERLLVVGRRANDLIDLLRESIAKLLVGPGLDEANEIGPMITRLERDRTLRLLENASRLGAEVIEGGIPLQGPGNFIRPALVRHVPMQCEMAQRETFGPILAVQEVQNEEEALQIANTSPFGLAASVWSSDIERAAALARRIDAGTRSVNMTIASIVEMPWGGTKRSGLGRMLSKEGVRAFTEVVALRLPTTT